MNKKSSEVDCKFCKTVNVITFKTFAFLADELHV